MEVLSQLLEDLERVIDDNDILVYDDTVSPNLQTTSFSPTGMQLYAQAGSALQPPTGSDPKITGRAVAPGRGKGEGKPSLWEKC